MTLEEKANKLVDSICTDWWKQDSRDSFILSVTVMLVYMSYENVEDILATLYNAMREEYGDQINMELKEYYVMFRTTTGNSSDFVVTDQSIYHVIDEIKRSGYKMGMKPDGSWIAVLADNIIEVREKLPNEDLPLILQIMKYWYNHFTDEFDVLFADGYRMSCGPAHQYHPYPLLFDTNKRMFRYIRSLKEWKVSALLPR